jgi:hypothetical protein
MVNPKPTNATEVRTQDMRVRSVLSRVRNQEKCDSALGVTENRAG